MNDQDQLRQALNMCFFYLKFRARTRKEILDYLHKKQPRFGWSEEVVDQTIARLIELKYIDDVQFIESFVRSRQIGKKSGIYALTRDLENKGISRDLINRYFEEHTLDQEQLAYDAVSSRWQRLHHLDNEKRVQKAMSFLQNRGFGYDIIKKTIAKLTETE